MHYRSSVYIYMARRCSGTTRAGKHCSIAESCTLTDDRGRLVAEPLRRGGDYCVFHAKPFSAEPTFLDDGRTVVLVFLDLESTGVDIARDRIVELAAVHAPVDVRFLGGGFSTLVRVDPTILKERGSAAAVVHGITDEEIALGTNFVVAWDRFVHWTEDLLNIAVTQSGEDSDDDDHVNSLPRMPVEPPILLLAAHNGVGGLVWTLVYI